MRPRTVTAYRVGETYRLETTEPTARPVTLALSDKVFVQRSAFGQLLLYHEHVPYGMQVAGAMALGWCWLVEEGEAAEGETAEGDTGGASGEAMESGDERGDVEAASSEPSG